jgi:hypothetical protein
MYPIGMEEEKRQRRYACGNPFLRFDEPEMGWKEKRRREKEFPDECRKERGVGSAERGTEPFIGFKVATCRLCGKERGRYQKYCCGKDVNPLISHPYPVPSGSARNAGNRKSRKRQGFLDRLKSILREG